MLKLYHFWSSTCSRKVRICLAEKNLEWESHHVDIVNKRENVEEWYVKLNPNAVVPTLDNDGLIVIESNIILEYLDDCFPDIPLKSETAYENAKMRLWLDKAETVVHKNINVISWNKRHLPRMSQYSHDEHKIILEQFPDPVKRQIKLSRLENGVSEAEELFAQDRLLEFMDDMEKSLENSPWLSGEVFSLADIAIAPFVERFEANGLDKLVDFSDRPMIGDWWERLKKRESYQSTYAFKNPDA